MDGLIDLWFAPARFMAGMFFFPSPAPAPLRFEPIVIHLSASRKWRRRMKIVRRARSGLN